MASTPTTPRFPRRPLAKIRQPGYIRTGQQDTDKILQDEVTRTRPCPRQLRTVISSAAMYKNTARLTVHWAITGTAEGGQQHEKIPR